LKSRFGIGSVCIVADRGMISAETLAEVELRKWQYILGVRMRSSTEAKAVVARAGRYAEVHPKSDDRDDPSPLKVKEVWVEDTRRYVVCVNEDQATKDRHDREAVVASLREALSHGDKSLVGNKGYRKYLRAGGKQFAVDEDKIQEEARYDGKWVLTTNTDLPTHAVALKYKQLWMVEDVFRSMKSFAGYPADFSQARRNDSRARILLVSGAATSQGTARSTGTKGVETGVGRRRPRSGQPE